LQQVAERVATCVRDTDVVAHCQTKAIDGEDDAPSTSRIGGDEFTLILPEIASPADAAIVAGRILTALRSEFKLDGNSAHIGASIGIACYPDDASDEETLLKYADMAMYQAKQAGKNTYSFFSQELIVHQNRKLQLISEIGDALERNELDVLFRSAVEFQSGRIVASEGNIVWNHPEYGVLDVSQFRPAIYESGYVTQITNNYIDACCQMLRRADELHLDVPLCSVGLSGRAFEIKDFAENFVERVRANNVDPFRIRVRLGLSSFTADSVKANKNFDDLARNGIDMEIDDFTRDGGSLDRMGQLPIVRIKVNCDQHAQGVQTSEFVIRAAMSIAKDLNFILSAKNVDSPEILAEAKKFGFTNGTGNLIDSLMPTNEFIKLLAQDASAKAKGFNKLIG